MTMTEFKPHLLTLNETISTDNEGTLVEHDFDVTCPGVTDRCRAYVDCLAKPEEIEVLNLGDPPTAHGKRHLLIDGTWMAATDQCLYATGDIAEAAEYLASKHALKPGTYRVDVDYRGDGELDLILLDERAVAR
jgi:hypothetical protein